MDNRRYNQRPYAIGDPLCQTCRKDIFDKCELKSAEEYDCPWHETDQDVVNRENKVKDARFLANTPERARELIDEFLQFWDLNKEPFTGNSSIYHIAGMKKKTVNALDPLVSVLDKQNIIEVLIHLYKISKGEK